ncbi:MAG: 4Fe-4S double cluster binding domain-containing protein [Actinomycetes bacterium]
MSANVQWQSVIEALADKGWSARVVAAARLTDVRARVAAVLESGDLPGEAAARIAAEVAFALPEGLEAARSVIVGAIARPLTQATLTIGGTEYTVPVPPHYAGYFTVPDSLAEAAGAALAPFGRRAVRFEPPLKTLAAGAGLASYGRNNIAYVSGLGSYFMLAACASDAPAPDDAVWADPLQLARCERCSACGRACPTGAIRADRFLLETERCLTFLNEDDAPFPDWVDPAWHTCAVGCLRCQMVCPENAAVELAAEPPVELDEQESAAILAATAGSELAAATLAKLERCGLDYSPELIARNLRALLTA